MLQVVNSLFQTCYNKLGTSSAKTTCWRLVCRLATSCEIFTCVANTAQTLFQNVFVQETWRCLTFRKKYSARLSKHENECFWGKMQHTVYCYNMPSCNHVQGAPKYRSYLLVFKSLFNARHYTCGNLMKLYFVVETGF